MKTQTTSSRETHRALIGTGLAIAGLFHYQIKSQDRPGIFHTVTVERGTGRATCTCEHFRYRCEKLEPTIFDSAEKLCKHLRTYRHTLQADAASVQVELPVMIAVIDSGEKTKFAITYWFNGQLVSMAPFHYVNFADHASDARARIEKVRSVIGDAMAIRVMDLTGEVLMERAS
jgi:hypothetical protein